jgi:hypothetical protein
MVHGLQGAAGAVIIVTLSPVDPNIVNNLLTSSGEQLFIKFIALALIGGYAGGALLESSAGQYAEKFDKRLGKFEETTEDRFEGIEEKTTSKIDELEKKQNELAQEAKAGVEASRMAEMILRGLVRAEEIEEFGNALKGASPSVRLQIAVLADDCRRQHYKNDKDALERALLVFKALVGTGEAKTNWWWYASLGYCLKDKKEPDYAAAVECFDKAIELRSPAMRSGAYEFNRAFCCIQIADAQPVGWTSLELEGKIRRDLEAAKKFPRFNDIIDRDETVQEWLRAHSTNAEHRFPEFVSSHSTRS